MDTVTGRPLAAVRLEGTLADGVDCLRRLVGDPKPGAAAAMEELRKTHFVVVVSTLARLYGGPGAILSWLVYSGIPYDDVWAIPGFPDADLVVDDSAVPLCLLSPRSADDSPTTPSGN